MLKRLDPLRYTLISVAPFVRHAEAPPSQLEQMCDESNIGPEAILNMNETELFISQVKKQQRIVPVSESHGQSLAKAKVDVSRDWITLIMIGKLS